MALMDWIRDNHAQQPSLGAEVKAMAREAVKDVRNTIHEVFFGKGEGMSEQGTPLNPTPQIVTQDMGNVHGYEAMLDGYSRSGHEQNEKGMER
ncbi:MAG: hypothetical protein SGI88_03535 [Candidatus Hydrogenedentes bacterium]|nr:hypothetical protein [Candidatus Hydrogenedentota bacterium]